MTPAVLALEKSKVSFKLHQYLNSVRQDFALEAATAFNVDAWRVFKTLITQDNAGHLYVAIVPTPLNLNLKKMAQACACKKMRMADVAQAERATGYLKGGISPFGQKTILPTYIDRSINQFDTIHVSAGKRGLEVELSPESLTRLCSGQVADLAGV